MNCGFTAACLPPMKSQVRQILRPWFGVKSDSSYALESYSSPVNDERPLREEGWLYGGEGLIGGLNVYKVSLFYIQCCSNASSGLSTRPSW